MNLRSKTHNDDWQIVTDDNHKHLLIFLSTQRMYIAQTLLLISIHLYDGFRTIFPDLIVFEKHKIGESLCEFV